MFCKSSKEEWSKVKEVLKLYEKGSGQMINSKKSSIVSSSNISKELQLTISQEVGGMISESCGKYLRLPTLIGRSKYNSFQWIKESVWNKISNWKHKFLSQAGREILNLSLKQFYKLYRFILWVSSSFQRNCTMNLEIWWLSFGGVTRMIAQQSIGWVGVEWENTRLKVDWVSVV